MLNKIMIIGHTGRPAELRYTDAGKPVASFSVAVTERWTDAGGQKKEHTEWVSVVAWARLAEVCGQYLDSKGRLVYVEGKLRTREYEDKEGHKRKVSEIIADNVRFLGGGNQQRSESQGSFTAPGGEDDMPF